MKKAPVELCDACKKNLPYLKGYWRALSDYGIWKQGRRYIGCLERDINEVMLGIIKGVEPNEEIALKILEFIKGDL